MSNEHIPAWQRIVIKQQQSKTAENGFVDEDPLNVTTHLATGTLTRKEKKRIIKGEDHDTSKKISKKKTKPNNKREKLNKEEREDKRKNTVLKDQLRYLIEFYLHKISDELPATLHGLPNVQTNYPQEKLDEKKKKDTVIDIWKFSKQKQNWLIKHFFDTDEIRVEYDDLLMSYFADLKSEFLRANLISKCWDIIKEWNDFAEKQEQEIKDIVEGEDKKDDKGGDQMERDENLDKANPKEQKEELVAPPRKEAVSRCAKLLKLWEVDGQEGRSIDLKNF